MSDNLNVVWNKFFQHRTRTLWERFPGYYRALVVETNDPLSMYRVRFKCPDMHDFSLRPEECPWAVSSFDLGGKRAGRFSHPCIGDWIWITFEKQHPYGPVWVGFATPTRRKFYSYPSVFQVTPLPVNEEGKPDKRRPDDYDRQFLPSDGRPMAHGWVDRYGNADLHSAVGFFPEEHAQAPPPADHDAVQKAAFQQSSSTPRVNAPDRKYMARVTKYGQMLVQADQGYHWKKEEGSEFGEFEGSAKKDEKYEIKRWKALQKALNEGDPAGDHRRIMVMNRYGSRLELRDTGWAQQGPIQSKSRPGEYGPPRILSKEEKKDYRWVKLRTKGGWLLQAYDKGFHPDEDRFVRRPVNDETGHRSEREDTHWADKDARWFRIVGRYGMKFVLDERGSDDKNADKREWPYANGWLLKGRRSGSVKAQKKTGDPRGFQFECNENDQANHTMWMTPMGLAMEMNDRFQYTMIAASMGKNWTPKFKGLKENEFIGKPLMAANPERNAHHLKLDHDNEYIRLKTRGGRGPRPRQPANPSAVRKSELQQGFEARDGKSGDGPYVELVDAQHRGFWLSKFEQLGIWRGKKGRRMYQIMDDKKRKIVIYNDAPNGTIEIYTRRRVNIISSADVKVSAGRNLDLYADRAIRMQAGDTRLTINGAGIHTNRTIFARRLSGLVTAGARPRALRVTKADVPELPEKLEPKDRGQTYNAPFEECPRDEIEHPTG